jgi:hypothetical protein
MSEQARGDAIRKEVLFQAYALRPVPVSLDGIHRECVKQRFDYSRLEISREVQFLCDRGLLFQIEDRGGTAHLYRIHAEGVAYYQQNYEA